MGLDVFFREDAARILAAVAIARDGLTTDERTILAAICAGFGLEPSEVLPPPVIMQLPARREVDEEWK